MRCGGTADGMGSATRRVTWRDATWWRDGVTWSDVLPVDVRCDCNEEREGESEGEGESKRECEDGAVWVRVRTGEGHTRE